jgi:DNA-binding CsgD family transcriptional regulator
MGLDALSEREHEVAALVASGCSTKQIAEALFVSPHTVRAHLRSIYRKLGAKGRVDVARAIMGASVSAPDDSPSIPVDPAG